MNDTINEKILVVDDDDFIRSLLDRHLTNRGYKVTTVNSAESAISTAEKVTFALALVDILMPGMNGIELLTQLKSLQPEILLITMTGHPSLETALEALKKGIHDYLIKPFRLEHLDQTINSCFEKRRIIEENKTLKDQLKNAEDQIGLLQSLLEESKEHANPMPSESTIDKMRGDAVYRNQSLKTKEKINQDRLQKLSLLKDEGLISEEEYLVKRKQFLNPESENEIPS